MIKMIAAVSTNGVIGKDGKIPWNYPEDMKFFQKITKAGGDGNVLPRVIMGRKTFESMGSKPLPHRENIVITSSTKMSKEVEGVIFINSLEKAVIVASMFIPKFGAPPDAWLIGGTRIYEEGMKYASKIYLTLIPEAVYGPDLTRLPWVDPTKFEIETVAPFEKDERLRLVTYKATTSDRCDKQSKS